MVAHRQPEVARPLTTFPRADHNNGQDRGIAARMGIGSAGSTEQPI